MSRFYQQLTHDFVQTKNRLHRVLQLTFPEIEQLFSTTDNHLYLEILSVFPHAQLASHNLRTLADTLQSISNQHIGQNRLNLIAHKLSKLARQSAPAVSLIAELGDLNRFKTSNQLNAFIGIDLRFNDSGQYQSSGFITERGNHIARKVLFKAIGNMASTATYGHPNHINDWYQKKKQSSQGVGTKKIAIGAMSRLIRTLHYLVLHNQLYDYELHQENNLI
ncbi:transposase [Fructobacillus evanidus]|uniref:Transposase n=1 Tax=Fructobacillus evanidus TaxID=3064281 RepID=A0ABM9MY68_9LACO|nr:Transposase [Fructobacillus sp. LMG 32999]CAK1241810.1 Transposase [Fructobacillus sp. LMG 32999]CAK1248555.1 Transposase [Fructobacillus sp. LMG 32999]CAK1248635.1 Transposase [Fructobacillus sp. LMG 32999]CAK1250263.1 Transposase [Fructobacillus sp. LMG 32999]